MLIFHAFLIFWCVNLDIKVYASLLKVLVMTVSKIHDFSFWMEYIKTCNQTLFNCFFNVEVFRQWNVLY